MRAKSCKVVRRRAPARSERSKSCKNAQQNALNTHKSALKSTKKPPKINGPSNTSVNISYNLEIGGDFGYHGRGVKSVK